MLRRSLALLAALALAGCAALGMKGDAADSNASRAYAGLSAAGFTGDFAVSEPGQNDTVYYGPLDGDSEAVRTIEGWPWASVTKQVMAVLVMREIEDGRIALTDDASRWVPALAGENISIENLLRHQSGLPQPDDTPLDAQGFPSFYTGDRDRLAFCTRNVSGPPEDGGWVYNNCDYIVLGAVLEAATGSSLDLLLAQGVGLEAGWSNTSFLKPGDARDFAGRSDVRAARLGGFGASAGLVGPLDDMLAFDRALMDGTLLGEAAMAQLWQSDPALGYMALGQWVFEAPLAGCEVPVRIVERRGAVDDYQVRNVILPDLGIALALATQQADWDYGEIWTGSGPMHDVLSTMACSQP